MNRHASLSLKGFTLLYFIYTIRQQPIHDFLSLTVTYKKVSNLGMGYFTVWEAFAPK